MAASKLGVYNSALLHLEERPLSALTETGNSRSALDAAWSDSLAYCLESGYWTFALKTIQLYADSAAATIGPVNKFTKPSDWVRTYRISDNENMNGQLFDLLDEGGVWFSNVDPLYVKYISNADDYGGDLSLWPATYAEYVATRLAVKTCVRITGNATRLETLLKLEKKARQSASDKDAMNEPPAFPARGSWVSARGRGVEQPPSDRTITT